MNVWAMTTRGYTFRNLGTKGYSFCCKWMNDSRKASLYYLNFRWSHSLSNLWAIARMDYALS